MKVTLVLLPYYTLLGMPMFFEIGPAYIAATLKDDGHDVSIINGEALEFQKKSAIQNLLQPVTRLRFMLNTSIGQSSFLEEVMSNPRNAVWDTIIERISKEKPDVIGLSVFTARLTAAKIISQRIKEDLGNIPIVLGGIHPSSLPVETLNDIPGADYVVMGEGEETIKELVTHLNNPTEGQIQMIKGLAYRDQDGNPVLNEPREPIHDLDSLPFPLRDPGPEHMVITGRGCPFNCEFCASHVLWGRHVRHRSVDNVIKEISELKRHYGAERIRIVDDTFTISKKRVIEFSQKIQEAGLNDIAFSVGSRVDTIDEEMAAALRSCGVKIVSFGVESGSPRILENICKEITPEQVKKAVALANNEKMITHTYYMIGHPGETREDIELSKKLLREAKATYAALNIVTIYPKTGYAEAAAQRNFQPLSVNDLYKGVHQLGPTVNLTELSTEELEKEYHRFVRVVRYHNLKRSLLILTRQPGLVLRRLFRH